MPFWRKGALTETLEPVSKAWVLVIVWFLLTRLGFVALALSTTPLYCGVYTPVKPLSDQFQTFYKCSSQWVLGLYSGSSMRFSVLEARNRANKIRIAQMANRILAINRKARRLISVSLFRLWPQYTGCSLIQCCPDPL